MASVNKPKPPRMRQIYSVMSEVILPDKIKVSLVHLTTAEVKEATVVVSDPDVLHLTADLIGFPLEEAEWGQYGENFSAQEIIEDTVKQAVEQLKPR
jgi:hypothetical protein